MIIASSYENAVATATVNLPAAVQGQNNLLNGRPDAMTRIVTASGQTSVTIQIRFPGATPRGFMDNDIIAFVTGLNSNNYTGASISAKSIGTSAGGQVTRPVIERPDGVRAAAVIMARGYGFVTGVDITITWPANRPAWIDVGEIFFGQYMRFRCIADEYRESREQRSSLVRSVSGQPYVTPRGTTERRDMTIAGVDHDTMYDGRESLMRLLSDADRYRPMMMCPMPTAPFSGGAISNEHLSLHSRIAINVGSTDISANPPYFRAQLEMEIPPEAGRR